MNQFSVNFLQMSCSVDKFTRYNIGKITDLESSYPQVGFWIIHLIRIRHLAFSSARATDPQEPIPVQHNLVLHHSMALQTKIIEGKAFNYVLHVFTRSWLGHIRVGGLIMQSEDFLVVWIEGLPLGCEPLNFSFKPKCQSSTNRIWRLKV